MLRRARIEKIITNNTNNRFFSATITWLDRDGGMYDEASFTANIQLSYSYISRSFGFQYYPVPGDIVLCGFCEEEVPIIIAFLSTEYYSKITRENDFQYYFRNIVEGEYSIKALQGNEIYLDRKGSLRFVALDQDITTKNLQDIDTKALNTNNYIRAIKHEEEGPNKGTVVDLTKQVLDYPKTELTIGKVFDEEYKEEQKLNDESIAVQIVGRKNTPKYDNEGILSSVDIEEIYKIQINTEGEIAIVGKKEEDEEGNEVAKYQINISKDGEISISTENTINVKANVVEVDGSLQVKDETGSNSGIFTTYSGTTVTVENGIITKIVP